MVQMTKTEKKVVRYANLEKWDYDKIAMFINESISYIQYKSLQGESLRQKTDYIINKFKPKMETKTKVTVLGEEPKKELKKIDLLYHVTVGVHIKADGDGRQAKWWDNIILIEHNYEDGLDLILAYNNRVIGGAKCKSLMLGNWNDGIV